MPYCARWVTTQATPATTWPTVLCPAPSAIATDPASAHTAATSAAHLRRGGRVELDGGIGGDAQARGGERGSLARRRVGDGDTVGQQRDVARAHLPGRLRGVRPDHDDAVGVHGAAD